MIAAAGNHLADNVFPRINHSRYCDVSFSNPDNRPMGANTGIGIIGAAYFAKGILTNRNDNTDYMDDLYNLVDGCTENANIINYSWGLINIENMAMRAIIDYAIHDKGIIFIAAMGHCVYECPIWKLLPAYIDEVVAVTACDSNKHWIGGYNNYGEHVWVTAPGVGIFTTTYDNGYSIFSGTSAAAPHVTGMAALMELVRPDIHWATVRDILRAAAEHPDTHDDYMGYGHVNANEVVHLALFASNTIMRGDVDRDGFINEGDIDYLMNFIFLHGPAPPNPNTADVNASGSIDLADVSYLISYLFEGGPPPPELKNLMEGPANIPRHSLSQNYPNPFNPTTTIAYSIPKQSHVNLFIYNIIGQKVRILVEGSQSAGSHAVSWDGTDENGQQVASGIYLYQLSTIDGVSQVKKMILLK
jgi:subtilisin family serine protease